MTAPPSGIADRIAAALAAATTAQSSAADPQASVWVAANAGTGKTHVLTRRVLRLLLAGTAPERLLCLTYTNAAAAEMSTRVFRELATWVTAAEDVLTARLKDVLGQRANADEMLRARQLFARAIETPGGLKVQTIHAFCERLLQRFPLEAGIAPHFSILDDDSAAALMREATDGVLARASANAATPLGRALATAIAYASETRFDDLLAGALRGRDWLEAIWAMRRDAEDPWPGIEAMFRKAMGLGTKESLHAVDAAIAALIPRSSGEEIVIALRAGSPTDGERAAVLSAYLCAQGPQDRTLACVSLFLTGKGEARKALATKAVLNAAPHIAAVLGPAQARFMTLHDTRMGLVVVEATMAMLRLADAVMQAFGEAKARRAMLDFEDLIARTANLLSLGEATQWVLYKLDGGLDHILVDEAQDTSPRQWRIIESLAREFFAGSGRGEVATARTLFAVGDEKQSIYSFQGARPALFAEMGDRVATQVKQTGQGWRRIPMTLSFRTVAPLLKAVDRVFANPDRTPGLTSAGGDILHIAHRLGQGGLLEIWETEKAQAGVASDAWSPLDEAQAGEVPSARLATRIAETIAGWLQRGDHLASQNRPARAGDILILLRRRRPMAAPIIAALKARGIPVAGADRMQLADQIVVQDLVALGDFTLLPEDDLALACVLKSPLIGLDDDDLLAIAPGRKGSLWSTLLAAGDTSQRYAAAVTRLKHWRARADLSPPFEFYAALLDHDGGRTRLMARLGSEAAEAIDAFLDEALAYDEVNPPSLQGFLGALKSSTKQIKRDMEQGRNEVRVLTVHGAKGLEAPIVFLADTCSAKSGAGAGSMLALPNAALPEGIEADPLAWPIKGTSKHPTLAAARAAQAASEAEERNRLLYVALTRPRDRLYIGGAEGVRGRDKGCWYDQIRDGLESELVENIDASGAVVWRLEAHQTQPNEPERGSAEGAVIPIPLPPWAHRPAPREPMTTIPLAPSRLAPLETDDAGDPVDTPAYRLPSEPSAPGPRLRGEDDRFLRGTITHALLQHLPGLPPENRGRAALGYVEARAAALPPGVRAGIVREVLAILDHPRLGALFGPASRAEVPIVAEIVRPGGGGHTLRLSGQIDRLVDLGHEVLIVDYKTNRPAPLDAAQVPRAYLLQLAAYRLGLRQIYPAALIRAAILWTDGARILEIASDLLDREEARIWTGDLAYEQGSLDAR